MFINGGVLLHATALHISPSLIIVRLVLKQLHSDHFADKLKDYSRQNQVFALNKMFWNRCVLLTICQTKTVWKT